MHHYLIPIVLMLTCAASAGAQQAQLEKGRALWRLRLAKSAIAAFEAAARDPRAAAEAHEALGRIYLFKGWLQEGAFPGWHDEPEYRDRALAELKAALAADPNRASAQEALRLAESYAAADHVPPAAAPAAVKELDAKLESYRMAPAAPVAEILAVLDARTTAQADPAPYFTTAQILLDRRDFDRAIELAQKGVAAAERFIAENEGAYKMSGKSQGALARSRAAAQDLIGWAAFLRNDHATAARQLGEAEQLSRGQDFLVQFHLAELAAARKNIDEARLHYLNALSLTAGPAELRTRATQALAGIHASLETPAGFEAWLDEALAERRRLRREAVLRSLVDRPLPSLTLTGMDGRAVDVGALRGKVLLLNFFTSW
jgi:tetratricopeptide (TPR) repeat protein